MHCVPRTRAASRLPAAPHGGGPGRTLCRWSRCRVPGQPWWRRRGLQPSTGASPRVLVVVYDGTPGDGRSWVPSRVRLAPPLGRAAHAHMPPVRPRAAACDCCRMAFRASSASATCASSLASFTRARRWVGGRPVGWAVGRHGGHCGQAGPGIASLAPSPVPSRCLVTMCLWGGGGRCKAGVVVSVHTCSMPRSCVCVRPATHLTSTCCVHPHPCTLTLTHACVRAGEGA